MNPALESNHKRPMPWALKIIIALAALLVLLILAFAVWRATLVSANHQRLKAIKAAGEPVTGRDLDAWYEPVDEKENAALVWLEGVSKLRPARVKMQPAAWSRLKLPPPGQRLEPPQLQEVGRFVEENREALELFRRAASMPKSRYPVDLSQGHFASLDHLTPLKGGVQLLQLESLLHAQQGRGREAAESVLVMLGAGRSLAQEPLLISQLVRVSMDQIAGQSVERALNLAALDEPQLAALQAAFAAAETPNLATRALIGERAISATLMNSPKQITPPPGDSGSAGTALSAGKSYGSPLVRMTGFFQRDLGFFLDAMETNIAIAKMPDPQKFLARTNAEFLHLQARRGYYVMSSLLLPALENAFKRDVEHRGRLRVAQTAMAVERYRLANQGRRPASLSELTPKYLPAVPLDPFDGEPLRFKPLASGYVIYSIGPDRTDDDGTPPPPSGRPVNKAPHDITFTVER